MYCTTRLPAHLLAPPPAAVKIKKPIQTKFRMPVLNWVALKPSQINGTVFNDIDDEAILQVTQTFEIKYSAAKHVQKSSDKGDNNET